MQKDWWMIYERKKQSKQEREGQSKGGKVQTSASYTGLGGCACGVLFPEVVLQNIASAFVYYQWSGQDLPQASLLCLQNSNSFCEARALYLVHVRKLCTFWSQHSYWINLATSVEKCLHKILTRLSFKDWSSIPTVSSTVLSTNFSRAGQFPVHFFPDQAVSCLHLY